MGDTIVIVVSRIAEDIIVIGLVLAVTVGLMLDVVEVVSAESEILVANSGSVPHLLVAVTVIV